MNRDAASDRRPIHVGRKIVLMLSDVVQGKGRCSMNDDDKQARYLIDQFNKYVSWVGRKKEVKISAAAVMLACVAGIVAVYNITGTLAYEFGQILSSQAIHLFAVAFLIIGLRWLCCAWKISREYENNERKLTALEDYRSRHKSLPEGLTFQCIIASEYKDLEKILKAASGSY